MYMKFKKKHFSILSSATVFVLDCFNPISFASKMKGINTQLQKYAFTMSRDIFNCLSCPETCFSSMVL